MCIFSSALVFYCLSGLGVTAGAHRLWAHRSYRAKLPTRIFLALCNSMAFQVSWTGLLEGRNRVQLTGSAILLGRSGMWGCWWWWNCPSEDTHSCRLKPLVFE